MLILTRKTGQSIIIGEQIVVRVISIDGKAVRLGIEAPGELPVYRLEIYLAICEENLRSLHSAKKLDRLQQLGLEKETGDSSEREP